MQLAPSASATTSATPSVAPPVANAAPAAPPSPLALDALRLGTGAARIHWHDAALVPPVDASLELAASLDGLLLGAPGDPARGSLRLRVPGAIERVQWDGTLRSQPDDVALDGALVAEGVRLGPLAAYLPPGCTSELRDGRLALRLSATSGASAGGGRRSTLRVSDLSWRDADGPPLLALDELALDVPRLDAAAGVADVSEIALTGLQLQAARRPGGALAALGFMIAPQPAMDAASATSAATAPAAPTPPVAHSGSLAALPLRDLRVAKLDLELRSLLLSDESGAGGAPLTLAARLSNPEPLVVLDRSRDDLQPCRLAPARERRAHRADAGRGGLPRRRRGAAGLARGSARRRPARRRRDRGAARAGGPARRQRALRRHARREVRRGALLAAARAAGLRRERRALRRRPSSPTSRCVPRRAPSRPSRCSVSRSDSSMCGRRAASCTSGVSN